MRPESCVPYMRPATCFAPSTQSSKLLLALTAIPGIAIFGFALTLADFLLVANREGAPYLTDVSTAHVHAQAHVYAHAHAHDARAHMHM